MISIIIPTYNEQDNITILHSRLVKTFDTIQKHDLEIIFVDDCSTDETPNILENLNRADARVKIIRFARNCGSHAAVAAGLHFCSGTAAVMIASDLQDPPEIIPRFIEKWEKGSKIVWGVRDKREGENFITLTLARIFYFSMNRLTDVNLPPSGADVFLIDRSVIEAFKNAPEKNTSIYMLIAWLGYSQTQINYVKEARHAGFSKWSTSRKLKLFFDSLISFSYVPLRLMSLMGAMATFIGLLYAITVFMDALNGIPVQGWASLMIVLLFIGGFQMIMMGMLGEYLWRAYDETRGRPRYVIEKNTLLDDISTATERKYAADESKKAQIEVL